MVDIVLTAPATEMSNHHGKEFLGFGTCSPPSVVPSWFVRTFFYPKVGCKDGVVLQAPYGLRKIEAKLADSGFNVVTVHPFNIGKFLEHAKAVGISVMDPLGFGPVSVTFTTLLGGNASTKIEFENLMRKIEPYKVRKIIGGPGAWQLEWDSYWKNRVDCIVIGEGEEVVVDIFRKAVNGEELPKIVKTRAVSLENIPLIKRPSINGLVEISRGCGRGCRFCSETLKRKRDIPIENIVKEAEICVKNGTGGVLLHAEDVLLYGCNNPRFIPNEEKVLNVFKAVKNVTGSIGISHCSLAAVVAKPSIVEEINEIIGIDRNNMLGVQTGMETGSPKIIEKYMNGKCLPFHPNEWCDVVEEAFAIMHENYWIPAATLIIGLPDEREEDVIRTIELVERLRDYRSLIVPLVFIPMEVCALKKQTFSKRNLKPVHYELMARCMDHDVHWVEDLMKRYFKGFKNIPLKIGYWAFVKWIKKSWSKRRREVLSYA